MLSFRKAEFNLSDLIGEIGGVAELLVKTVSFLLGGYLSFNASLEIIDSLYSCNHEIQHLKAKATLIRSNTKKILLEGGQSSIDNPIINSSSCTSSFSSHDISGSEEMGVT